MRLEIIIALVTAALPTLTVLVGIRLNRNESSRLENRIATEIARLDARLSALAARLEAKISGLENRLHSDMLQVIGKLTEFEVRVARLEEKQSR